LVIQIASPSTAQWIVMLTTTTRPTRRAAIIFAGRNSLGFLVQSNF
jgi:hypothetical protein